MAYFFVCKYDCTVKTTLLYFLLNVKSIYLARDYFGAIFGGDTNLTANEQLVPCLKGKIMVLGLILIMGHICEVLYCYI